MVKFIHLYGVIIVFVLHIGIKFERSLMLIQEKVSDCYELILEVSSTSPCFYGHEKNPHKRKYEQIPSSPSGVIDAILSSDSSNDSWAFGSVSSSPEPLFKKSRSGQMPSLNRVFVDAVGSPH